MSAAATWWRDVRESLTRPYRVTMSMLGLVSLVPLYLVIARNARGSELNVPAMPWDDRIPLRPEWALVYGALYGFLIVLPVLVVRDDVLIRRAVRTYLGVWITAYVVFLVYPTVAPRPAAVAGDGFDAWALQFLYDADPPYNCFPSLHVAHAFVSALASHRVHRGVGRVALACAALVAVSTLLTKQHYLGDVVGGLALAFLFAAIFLRGYPPERTPAGDRRVAPAVAAVAGAAALAGLGIYWVAYRLVLLRGMG